MAFYSAASGVSLWRGVDYYKDGKVASFEAAGDGAIRGIVSGSEGRTYDVAIDVGHPRKSTCSCPFAEGCRVICKHMIALYFASIPGSFELFEEDMRQEEERYEREEERWKQETFEQIRSYVAKLSAKEARERLTNMLYQDELDRRYRNNDYW